MDLDDLRVRPDEGGPRELRSSVAAGPARQGGGVGEPDTGRFLEALAAWCIGMPGYFRNRGVEQPRQPDWNLVARMLLAASTYE
jgi:hypothetical protein